MDEERKRELKRAFKQEERAQARRAMALDRSQLDSLLNDLDAHLAATSCDHTLRLTRAWAAEHALDSTTLTASLAHFGAYCDCEVAANVDPESIF